MKHPNFAASSREPEISTKFWSKINKKSLLWFVSITFKIQKLLKKIKPKFVIYHGDTMSTAAASIASSRLFNFGRKSWKNVHLEAGLRSGSMLEPFPEEISRRISDIFSDILFAVSDLSKNNLEKENNGGEIIVTGNTIVDSAEIGYDMGKKMQKKILYKYALINIHRHENLRNKERMRKITDIICHAKINSIWPLHDNTKLFLEKYGLIDKIRKNKKIRIIPLMSYPSFIFLLANSEYLITDGGSIQEESLIFKKPCIILRGKTERQEGLKTGINFLTRMDVNYSKKIIMDLERNIIKSGNIENPYGERGLSKNIVEILK